MLEEAHPSLEAYFDQLDREKEQEEPTVGIVSLANRNIDLIRERDDEYRDIEKHFVRRNYWLKVAQRIKSQKHSSLRYLTLPAYYRLDVSLFLQEDLIEVTERNEDGTPKEIYVAAFETEPTKYGRMAGQSPNYKMFGLGKIEDALTETGNKYYRHLLDLFPFDIINLDLTNSLTPDNEGPFSRTLQAIDNIFKRQAENPSVWALFLTFRNMPENWNERTLEILFNNLQENLKHGMVSKKFFDHYQVHDVRGLQEKNLRQCISQAVIKWLVDRSHHYGMKLESINCCKYTRYPGGRISRYDIYKHVLLFSKGSIHPTNIPTKSMPDQAWTITDLVNCIEQHKCEDIEDKLLEIQGKKSIFEMLASEIDALCGLIE